MLAADAATGPSRPDDAVQATRAMVALQTTNVEADVGLTKGHVLLAKVETATPADGPSPTTSHEVPTTARAGRVPAMGSRPYVASTLTVPRVRSGLDTGSGTCPSPWDVTRVATATATEVVFAGVPRPRALVRYTKKPASVDLVHILTIPILAVHVPLECSTGPGSSSGWSRPHTYLWWDISSLLGPLVSRFGEHK